MQIYCYLGCDRYLLAKEGIINSDDKKVAEFVAKQDLVLYDKLLSLT